jgi:DNA-binding NarL/FixJ family response regulator
VRHRQREHCENIGMKVLLVDDHPLILTALQTVIQRIGSDVTVVGVDSAAGARATLAEDPDFDLVLLDLALGDADGFDVLEEFRAAYPAVPVVVVSASERASDVIRAIDLGSMGFVPKSSSHAELHQALGMVMSGGMYVPPSMLGLDFSRRVDSDTIPGVMRPSPGPDTSEHFQYTAAGQAPLGAAAQPAPHQRLPTLAEVGLTPRQSEVLGLLLQGLPNKLIARQLNLSVETVKDHVAAVLRALGVSSRTQAVLAVSQMTQGQGGFTARRPPGT